MAQTQNRKFKSQLYWLLIVFATPIIASWLLYYFHDHFHFKTTNHGILLNPPINAAALFANQTKTWKIIYLDNGNCDAQCKKSNYDLNQVQKALGKDCNRVNVIELNGHDVQLQKFPTLTHNQIYLMDPIGNIFMSYPTNTNAMNVLKDLKHVLEVSQIS